MSIKIRSKSLAYDFDGSLFHKVGSWSFQDHLNHVLDTGIELRCLFHARFSNYVVPKGVAQPYIQVMTRDVMLDLYCGSPYFLQGFLHKVTRNECYVLLIQVKRVPDKSQLIYFLEQVIYNTTRKELLID